MDILEIPAYASTAASTKRPSAYALNSFTSPQGDTFLSPTSGGGALTSPWSLTGVEPFSPGFQKQRAESVGGSRKVRMNIGRNQSKLLSP